ncbi:MAG: acyl dehydratase [Bermanella sp.]|jgi:acyl dehydratase
MTNLDLSFTSEPSNIKAMIKALVLPRKGFDKAVGLPKITATWKAVKVDSQALNNYLQTLSLEKTDYLPILYPHIMVGSMHMNMLSHKEFPIRLLGSVHLKNRITQHQAIADDSIVDLYSQVARYRLVEKGVEFDFVTEVSIEERIVWEEVSTFFKAGSFGGRQNPTEEKSFELESLANPEPCGSWHVPNNRGKKYAKISGDYNPIHMSPLAAKLFGFKRDIAHGFGVLAETIEYSSAIAQAGGMEKSLQVDVVFKAPIFLGSDATIKQNITQDPNRVDVFCNDNPKPSMCVAVLAV